MRLTHIRLLVRDFPRAFRFWRDAVGLTVLWGDENGGYADFDVNGGRLAIFVSSAMAQVAGSSTEASRGPDQAVLVFAVDDVDAWHARLNARGVEFVTPPTDMKGWGVRVALFRDPEGNLVEINRDLAS